jgi:hypothetical protein
MNQPWLTTTVGAHAVGCALLGEAESTGCAYSALVAALFA